MNKRAMAMRRAAARKVAFLLLLLGVLAVETLTMAQLCRGFYKVPGQLQVTVDPGLVLQSW